MPQSSNFPQDPLAGLLAWYRAMGADAAVGDAAIDWAGRAEGPGAAFRPQTAPLKANAQPAAAISAPPSAPRNRQGLGDGATASLPPAARQFVPQAPVAAQSSARRLAESAHSLADLVNVLTGFDGCGLKTTATHVCVFRGAETARLMIVGEAPGREEDLAGKPFVGPAGQLLDKMLLAAGLQPDAQHITNTVYWRPPGNRAPTPEETEICRPFLERQMALVKPEFVLVLGGTAAKAVLGVTEGITRVRGKWQEIDAGGRKVRAMASLHPAYLLRTPAAKRQAWIDLLTVRAALGTPKPH